MEYAILSDATPSRLGFGCMRLPLTAQGAIDEPRAAAMLDAAYRAGVNYFDTAYFYHNHTSEAFVGRALARYPRESVYIATKMPLSVISSLEDARRIFEGQLTTMGVTYFDFYLLHAVNGKRWQAALDMGLLAYLEEQKRAGRIRRLGFSFHDSYAVFERVLTHRKWDFCQIQFNYMDVDAQAGMRGYALAERLGVPMIVMEPVKGGRLAAPGAEQEAAMRAMHPDWSPASWAMRWVASLPNCKVILSGMSDEEQVADNLRTFDHLTPLGDAEQALLADVRAQLRARMFVGCTDCRYCMPCPFGVDIPGNFQMMNAYSLHGDAARVANAYKALGEAGAHACRRCGKCEQVCPQQLPIREKLGEIAAQMRG